MNKRNARLETKPSETDWIPVTSSAGNSACRSFENSNIREDCKLRDFSFKRSELRSQRKSPLRLSPRDRRSDMNRSGFQENLLNFEARESRTRSPFSILFSNLRNCSPRLGSAFKVETGRQAPEITPFEEDPVAVKLEDSTGEGLLQKRKPGRPKKEAHAQPTFQLPPAKELKVEKPLSRDVQISPVFGDFYSDGEFQSLHLDKAQLSDNSIRVMFGPAMSPRPVDHAERRDASRKNCLDFKRVIDSINTKREKEKVQRFICRFCGKAFDKPSSLGGHTAKTHNGLSIKYKNRVEAAKNRKAERSRTKFLKIDAEKLVLDTNS